MTSSAPSGYVRRRSDRWLALGGVAVVAVCSLIAGRGLGEAEEALFRAVNGLPDVLDAPMAVVQLGGVLAIAPAAAVVALLLRRLRLGLALAAVAPLKLLVEKSVIKALVERERPGALVADAVLRGDVPAEGLSFPSGHAIVAFAVALLVVPYLGRRVRAAVLVGAIAVAVSRVYLGAHLPLDVVAGAATGVTIAAALNLVFGVPAGGADGRGLPMRGDPPS